MASEGIHAENGFRGTEENLSREGEDNEHDEA